jgi:L-aspartate oxidase
MTTHGCDVLVIGSGIAGLSFALRAAEHGSVALVTKKERAESNTNYAQGGIAAVMDPGDAPELHVQDTLLAGAGLCHAAAVQRLVREGPARVRELIEWGVRFSSGERGLALGREGGHSRRRIVHAGDTTGREIERALLEAVSAHPGITLCENHHALDLLIGECRETGEPRCGGALVLDHPRGEVLRFDARLVMLATGGLAQAFMHTTNPAIATGDGVAMAYRAGAEVANLEFVQFHPTALYPAGESAFLISEAVRGEGAVLRRIGGEPLNVDPLAPRDIVARAIDRVLKETGEAHVWLDVSPIGRAEEVAARFPGIAAGCAVRGIDISRQPIPVVPAAHYACGGVVTDADGRTSLAGLFAAGEVACTGVHGANRLASNSLLEAVVFSHRAALRVPVSIRARVADARLPDTTVFDADALAGGEADIVAIAECRGGLRTLMWEHAGIVRSADGLAAAADQLQARHEAVVGMLREGAPEPAGIELRNLIEVARLIVQSARLRRESRGLHYMVDFPYRDNERYLSDTILNTTLSRRAPD